MEIIILLLIIYGFNFLSKKDLNKIHSNLGKNVAKKHLKDEFGVDTDKKEK